MQKAAPTQRSSYLTALSQEIERKLQKALNSPSQRLQLLQQLFADIALEVDERARGIIVGGGEDKISKAKEDAECRLCFYDVLAEHFVIKPENGKRILDLIVLLWSQSFASHIFSLLFHKWLFEVPVEKPEALLRYGSALVQGATNVFWIDIQTNTRSFLSLFCVRFLAANISYSPSRTKQKVRFVERLGCFVPTSGCQPGMQLPLKGDAAYLLEDVALFPSHLEKISSQARRDLFHLLSRFLFFYNFDHTLKDFLKHFPISSNAFLVGGPGDIFVIELTDQLQKLKVEPVLLHYLTCLRALQGLELRMTTSTRLKVCLYSFTSPGGPMYPTRAVRHAAWDALDLLFPVGQYPRHIISLFFRLLYPWYWPSSCWNFIKTCITTILQSLLGLIFSSWQRMKNSKVD